MGSAERIPALRERTGKTSAEAAKLAGFQTMEYYDLEAYDDELSMVPSLAGVKRLAMALGVTMAVLFLDDGAAAPVHRVPYSDLVARVRSSLAAGTSQQELEDQIGWSLDDFLANEERALSEYPVGFLKALCGHLGVSWIEALP